MTPWRNGSASGSSPEGCVFESRRGQLFVLVRESNRPFSSQGPACLYDCKEVARFVNFLFFSFLQGIRLFYIYEQELSVVELESLN